MNSSNWSFELWHFITKYILSNFYEKNSTRIERHPSPFLIHVIFITNFAIKLIRRLAQVFFLNKSVYKKRLYPLCLLVSHNNSKEVRVRILKIMLHARFPFGVQELNIGRRQSCVTRWNFKGEKISALGSFLFDIYWSLVSCCISCDFPLTLIFRGVVYFWEPASKLQANKS